MAGKLPSSLLSILGPDGRSPDRHGQEFWRKTCWDRQNLAEMICQVRLDGVQTGGQGGLKDAASMQGFGSQDQGGYSQDDADVASVLTGGVLGDSPN